MKGTLSIPIWAHLTFFAITFLGWTGVTYFLEGPRNKAGLAEAVLGGFLFSGLMAFIDGVILTTAKAGRK
jgi:hypothetical protein